MANSSIKMRRGWNPTLPFNDDGLRSLRAACSLKETVQRTRQPMARRSSDGGNASNESATMSGGLNHRRGRRVYGSAAPRSTTSGAPDRSAVTLPQLLDEVVGSLEQHSDVETALCQFFDLMGMLFGLEAIALFTLPVSVSESPTLIQGFDVGQHQPTEAILPPQLLAGLRLQQKGIIPLNARDGLCSPSQIFQLGRPAEWGLAVAIEERGSVTGLLVLAAQREPSVKGDFAKWLGNLGQHLGWCMNHVQLTRELPLASMLRALDGSVGAMAVTDARGRVQYANAQFVHHAGTDRKSVIGQSYGALFKSAETKHHVSCTAGTERPSGQLGASRTEVLSAQEGNQTMELEVTPILDDRGAVTHGLLQLRERVAHVEVMADTGDEWRGQLAALPSRELLLDRVQGGLNRLKRRRMRHMALIVLNIDRFRVVTESLGEQSGNELLVQMARTIESLLMDSDTVAWLGADEFGVFLEDLRDPSDAIRLCMRLESLLTDPIRVDGSELFITCSAGIALASAEHVQARALFRDANTALHRAKKSSNAMYCIFDRDMHREARERLSLETDLRRAIERDELLLNFQPIVDLHSGSVDAFEALVRWSRDAQIVPPNDFIPLAEDTGLIVDVGRWVLDTACREAKGWLDASGPSAPSVSVNVSPIQFEHHDIFEHVTDALEQSGLPPNRLKLEITESCLMESVKQKIALLNRLRAIGVTTQVDDFGTGYSSLGLLTQLPVDSLKIDRSFVGRMSTGAADGKVVRAVIELAHSLGMKVTAEGIEFDDQRDELLALACDRGQGYLFARPMSAQAAVKTMKRIHQLPQTHQPGGEGGGALEDPQS